MTNIPLGLQLYSVRHDLADDLVGTIKAAANMGYVGVEFFGPPQHSAAELKTILDDNGLVCCGWHTPFTHVQDEKLEETIAFNQTLDNKYVIVPGIPAEHRQSGDDWRKLADFFNQVADKLAVHGMVTGYHNHHIEFADLDGEKPWDTFFSNTNAPIVMQLDTGNAILGGGDVIDIVKKYSGRATTVHLKPYSHTAAKDDPHHGFRPVIGDDETDWPGFFEACETVGGTEWYIVEYESDAYPPLEAVDLCLQNLKKMGK
ncbi:MAG: sugar phosphate isomerase/epimerase [Chloroflexota bacterium]